jgi:hypothetical protein
MNRNILVRISTPALLIGLLLIGTCLINVWYINRLERNLAQILSEDVTSLEAAQMLEIRVRQLRFHCFLNLIEPNPERLRPVKEDEESFENALQSAWKSATTGDEQFCLREIKTGYHKYHDELAALRAVVLRNGPVTDFKKLADTHPVRHVVEPCQEFLRINKEMMQSTAAESANGATTMAMLAAEKQDATHDGIQ